MRARGAARAAAAAAVVVGVVAVRASACTGAAAIAGAAPGIELAALATTSPPDRDATPIASPPPPEAIGLFAAPRDPNPLLPEPRLVGELAMLQEEEAAGAAAAPATSRKPYILPVILSAIVPGTGEIAAGHPWRGLPLIAIDVATWIGYAHYRTEGDEWRTSYEAYADAHWNYSRFGDSNANGEHDPGEVWGWQENLERYFDSSQPDPALRFWDPSQPYNCNCPYISREDDRQHYYENIGKYVYYWMGWDDWLYNPNDPGSSDSQGHRREYGLMRIESNENYDHATSLLYVAMATRLVSVVQSVLLVRKDLNAESRLSLEPALFHGKAPGIRMRLAY